MKLAALNLILGALMAAAAAAAHLSSVAAASEATTGGALATRRPQEEPPDVEVGSTEVATSTKTTTTTTTTTTLASAVASTAAAAAAAKTKENPSLSCFVCSTMDYDNPADNHCRQMLRPKSAPALASSSPFYQQHKHQAAYSGGSSQAQNQSPATTNTNSNSNQSSLVQQQQRWRRHLRPGEPLKVPVKTRQCFEDENFCSIVSVVRIDFVNDTVLSRFWALERNCSKSCNSGCMLIGERVRLRVCSTCCKASNCNVGGAATRPHPAGWLAKPQLLALAALLVGALINGKATVVTVAIN